MEGRPVEPSRDRRMAEKRLGLRREEEQPTAVPVIERLFPESVARHEQTTLRVVPDGEGEHPGEALDTRLAVDRVRVQDHLGVAPRSEPTPPGLELGAQLAEVVDLAVEDDPVPSGGVAHRLPAGYEIDDRQPRHPETDIAGGMDPRVVGPSVLEEPEHRGQELARGRADVAGDTAHQCVLTADVAIATAPSLTSRRSASTRPVVRAGV